MTYLVYMNYMMLVFMCDYMQILPSEFIGILIILGYVALAVHIFFEGQKKGERRMSEELKPCPFCGCHDRRVGVRKMGNKGYRIICGKCGCAGPYVKIKEFPNKMDAQGKAKETWNRRVKIEIVKGV